MKLWQLALFQIAVCSIFARIGYGTQASWIDYCIGFQTALGVVWLSGYKLERLK